MQVTEMKVRNFSSCLFFKKKLKTKTYNQKSPLESWIRLKLALYYLNSGM